MVNNARGRPRGPASARARLLDAAHRHFDAGDLAEISSRDLAAEVGVSHTLVNYYFGSRNAFIAAAVSLRVAPHHVIAAATMLDGTLHLPRLARGLIAVWEHPEHGQLLAGFARQLTAGGPHAQALSSYLQHTVLETLTAEFGQERARRMTTALVGVVFSRYVIRLPGMTALTADQTATHLLSMMRSAGPSSGRPQA
ncbi:TetR family transcriptional regulator [Microbacterium sp. P07]|uniref:TetR/AcrR family transcriptional regulator n=1 Tax=Microbacterium sp. P07 TaxID=3366952 RepID=UPI003745C24E